MAQNFGVNCKIWPQILHSTLKFAAKFVELMFAQPIIPCTISRRCQDDVMLCISLFGIFSSIFGYPSARPNWSKFGIDSKNFIVLQNICQFGGNFFFCSLLQNFWRFLTNFKLTPLFWCPEKKKKNARGWFKSNLNCTKGNG